MEVAKLGWQSSKSIWVAAGGTAGHLLPALGVADALVESGLAKERIGFIGSNRDLEPKLVSPAGYELIQLETRGLVRSISCSNLIALGRLIGAVVSLASLAMKDRPKVVIGFGGYFSFPPMLVAWLLRIPSVVVETNAVAGLANRMAAATASRVLVAGSNSGLADCEVVSVPLRPEIRRYKKKQIEDFGFRNERLIPSTDFVVCVFGGSLGSTKINQVVLDLVESFRARGDLEITFYHVIGSRDFLMLKDRANKLSDPGAKVKYLFSEFDPHIYEAIAESNLIISRAGSGTVAELGVFAKPAVLIPLPNAPGDHQKKNAQSLEDLGAAVVILDEELTVERLGSTIRELYLDPKRLGDMAEKASESFLGDGADRICEVVIALMENVKGKAWSRS